MIYITEDTHGQFDRLTSFCSKVKTSKSDIMIILGDAGINYLEGARAEILKRQLSSLPIQLFCIHGNHENRPSNIPSYQEVTWHGGTVYEEKEYPSILFAKDGEIYDLDGISAIAIGGAYSIDKPVRLVFGYKWWADEQPSPEIKAYVEKQLSERNWEIDVVLSHTVPIKYEPSEAFMPVVDQSQVDKSTEIWLGQIEEKLNYKKWYAGHFHLNKKIDRLYIMFEDIVQLDLLQEGLLHNG